MRLAFMQTKRITTDGAIAPADIAENLDKVMDTTEPRHSSTSRGERTQ